MSLETSLRYIASNLQYELQDMNIRREPAMAIRRFINDYQVYFNEYKAFKTKMDSVPVKLRLPGLKAGNYQVIVEANDINSGRNDLAIEDLYNPRDYVLAPGQEAFQFIKTPVFSAPGPGESDLSPGMKQLAVFEEIEPTSPLVQELQDESIDQNMLPGILRKVASYCKRLEAISLNFFCTEEIAEKAVNAVQQQGKIFKGKTVTENRYTYGYQLIRDKNKVREKRILLKQNGWKREIEDAPLKTRFKYKNIVYGPSSFNQRSQPYYQYRINGIRFPSRVYYEEAYKNRKGKLIIQNKEKTILK